MNSLTEDEYVEFVNGQTTGNFKKMMDEAQQQNDKARAQMQQEEQSIWQTEQHMAEM